MANHFQLTVVPVFLFSIAVSLPAVAHAINVINFTFPSQKSLVELRGNASYQANTIQLGSSQPLSSCWVVYNKSVPLWDASSPATANFSTHFQFKIQVVSNNPDIGDGLTFFLAPLDFKPVENSKGSWLGLFNETTNGKRSNRIVAVEFDTYQNTNLNDPDYNHVGIDVNSLFSSNVSSLDTSGTRNFKDAKYWDAWVDYNGESKNLEGGINWP